MDKRISAIKDMDRESGTIYGASNKVDMVNPYKSRLEVTYYSGEVFKGKNLFITGWVDVKDGIKELKYRLSTGHLIIIPKFKAYFPTIEVSESIDGFKLFHAIHVKCLAHDKVVKYSIILKQDKLSKYNIGDVIVSQDSGSLIDSPYWRMSCN